MNLPCKGFLFLALVISAMSLAADAQDRAPSLTIDQIMADPDWLGNAPKNPFWGADSHTVYYQQKRQGSELSDLFAIDSNNGSSSMVPESEWSQRFHSSITYNLAGDQRAYVYEGDVYLGNS